MFWPVNIALIKPGNLKQLITFFGLAYTISWLTWLPLYGQAIGFNGLHALPFNHALGALGPLAASFITTGLFYKRAGIKQLIKRCCSITPLLYTIIAAFGPFVLVVIAAGASALVNKTTFSLAGLFTNNEFPAFSFPVLLAYNLFFFGFGEEVGWRGFALPHLQGKFTALVSAILLTILWALWHLPLFFYRPGYTSMDYAAIAGWLFSLLTGSILLTWLFNASRASIFVCAVFHSTIDIVFTCGITDKSIINYMGMMITICGVAAIIIFKPANLALTSRVKALP